MEDCLISECSHTREMFSFRRKTSLSFLCVGKGCSKPACKHLEIQTPAPSDVPIAWIYRVFMLSFSVAYIKISCTEGLNSHGSRESAVTLEYIIHQRNQREDKSVVPCLVSLLCSLSSSVGIGGFLFFCLFGLIECMQNNLSCFLQVFSHI